MYEKQADQTDLSQINKANACMDFSQINSKVTDVKWPMGTVAIVVDSIMSGIREKLLKTDKHNVKVSFFKIFCYIFWSSNPVKTFVVIIVIIIIIIIIIIGATIEDMENYIKSILKREPDYIILDVGTKPTKQQIWQPVINLTNTYN